MNRPVLVSSRENDNATEVNWDEQTRTLTVRAEPRFGAKNIWFRFRLEGLNTGDTIHLNVLDVDERAGFIPLYLSWDDMATWTRTSEANAPYAIKLEGATLEVSRNLPYSYRALQDLCTRLTARPATAQGRLERLCLSEQGRDVPIFVIGPTVPDAPLIWVQARSHAFESHTSRVAEALIDWIAGEQGRFLRENARVCIIPMIDVDAVCVGSAGKDRTPHDPNRDYALEHYPQTQAIKKRLLDLTRTHPLRFFIDLHSPWYYNKCMWYVPPRERNRLVPFTERFSKILHEMNPANSWHDELFDPTRGGTVKSNPVRVAASTFARSQWPEAIATTMEIAHDQDAHGRSITQRGLEGYACALGATMASFISAQGDVNPQE